MNSSTQQHTGASNPSIISGRTYSFNNGTTVMIDGAGKKWTTANQTTGGAAATMPNPDNGTFYGGGRCGNGYCRITVTLTSM